MNFLRQRLLKQYPQLHAALEKSWDIAREKWLSSIPPSAGSYNSAPHFQNIEAHLDGLLAPSGASRSDDELAVPLSGLELYLLLASVLFHDVGRVRGDTNHAYASHALLHHDFSYLGVPSFELACSLARIAVYHDPVKKVPKEEKRKTPYASQKRIVEESQRRERGEAKAALREVIIEPYGRARELYVATMLALADHLDASARRTEPQFVHPDDEVMFKGAFRRMVLGSAYDLTTLSIKTCLHNPWEHAAKHTDADLNPFDLVHGKKTLDIGRARQRLDSKLNCPLYAEMKIQPSRPRNLFCMCLNDEKLCLERKAEDRGPWPQDYVLAVVLRDLNNNRKFLELVKDDLKYMGMPIESWLIEFDGKTYDHTGNEEPEPIFIGNKFLADVAFGMIELSNLAFAHGLFSYQMLADSLREPNVDKVRLAVHRLKRDPKSFFSKAVKVSEELEISAFPLSWEMRKTGRTTGKAQA